jgi:excisionase family DNA binding protein
MSYMKNLMQEEIEHNYMTVTQAMKSLNKTRPGILHMIKVKKLAAFKMGKNWLVEKAVKNNEE